MRKKQLCSYPLAGIIAAFVIVLLTGCGGSDESSSPSFTGNGQSGITGTVTQIPASTTSTQSTPVGGATISVQPQGGGSEITRVTSDSGGNYKVVIMPGTYTLVPQPISSNLVPVATGQNVTVRLNQYSVANFSYFNPTSSK